MMKSVSVLSLLLLAISTAVPATAQSLSVGVMAGASQVLHDDLSFRLDEGAREVFFGAELEHGTIFKLKVGQTGSSHLFQVADADSVRLQGDTDYAHALVEYRFSEVFGSTGLFLGPGYYRFRSDASPGVARQEETDWGLHGGVNAHFPITRRFAGLVEVGYHWVNFEERHRFLTVLGGIRVAF